MKAKTEQAFHTCTGEVYHTLEELALGLKEMADLVYMYHTTGDRNDFADWVQHIFKNEELATSLRRVKDRQEAFGAMETFLPKVKGPIAKKAEQLKMQLSSDAGDTGLFHRISKRLKNKKEVSEELAEEVGQEEHDPIKKLHPTKVGDRLDLMDAHLTGLKEARKITGERFLKVANELGSLRTKMMHLERDLQQVMLRVAKAVDLVEAVQPEKYRSDIEKQNARMEVMQGHIEGNKAMGQQVLKELKELRAKMSVFRGVEQVIKMNEEVTEKLKTVEKVKAMSEKQADAVANMFAQVKKRFERFEKFEQIAKEAQNATTEIAKDVQKITINKDEFATKEDLEKAKEETAQTFEGVVTQVSEVEKELADIEEKVMKADEQTKSELEQRRLELTEQFGQLKIQQGALKEKMGILETHSKQMKTDILSETLRKIDESVRYRGQPQVVQAPQPALDVNALLSLIQNQNNTQMQSQILEELKALRKAIGNKPSVKFTESKKTKKKK